MYYSDELIEEVRSKNDIVDVISGYVKLQKRGSSYVGLCPFHNEKTPSFSVDRQKQMYHCFGCGAGGTVFTFLQEYENMTFQEAMQFLADRAGIELPEEDSSREAKKQADERSVLLEINKTAAQYFYAQLISPRGEKALQYLKGRGLSDETIRGFGLGYSNIYSDDLYRYLKEKGYTDEMLVRSGLITVDEKQGAHDKFWNRVMFPIMDVNSRVIGFGGRVLGDGKPKYMNSPETRIFDKSRNLYGLYRAKKSRKPYFLLCEGYMDVIALNQAGFTNAVASLGTALTEKHANLLTRYIKEAYLTYDNDEPGIKAALRAVSLLRDVGIPTKVVNMDPYNDPDEFIRNLGAEAYQERIDQAQNGFMFSLTVLEKDYDMHSPEGKTAFLQEAARRLGEFEDEVETDTYTEAVAQAYHTSVEGLKKLVKKMKVGPAAARPRPLLKPADGREKKDGIQEAQKVLLTWMSTDPAVFAQLKDLVTPQDFSEGLYRQVAELLYAQYQQGQVDPAGILDHFPDADMQQEAASLFNTKIPKLSTKKEQEKALKENVVRVKNHSIEEAARQMDPTDVEALQDLVTAKKALQDLQGLSISISNEI